MVRVLVADDHQLTLEAVKAALLETQGIKIVAEARSGRQALAAVARCRPDVALIDMHMPGAIDGLTCAERIRKRRRHHAQDSRKRPEGREVEVRSLR